MLVDLLRHGETEMPGRLLGRTDAPLAQAGWEQFARQTDGRQFDGIVASPRQRARLPAEALASARRLPIRIDEDWAELDFGDWDGRALAELNADAHTAAALQALYQSDACAGAPGGEDWRSLGTRVERAIDRLFAFDADSRVLVSTHAGPMRTALAIACGLPFSNTWAFRIGLGTRVTLRLGRDPDSGLWGEIMEVVQP